LQLAIAMMIELLPSARSPRFERVGRLVLRALVLAPFAIVVTSLVFCFVTWMAAEIVGLSTFSCKSLATLEAEEAARSPSRPLPPPAIAAPGRLAAAPVVRIVDVSGRISSDELVAQLQLDPEERVSAINDRPVDAGADQPPIDVLLSVLTPLSGGYLDVTVSGATTERRVLVLMH
jgi:hypothetical protein